MSTQAKSVCAGVLALALALAAPAAATEIPAGTSIVIRMIDEVDSKKHEAGDTFRASVDEAVTVDGATVIPRGADVQTKLVSLDEGGKLTGRSRMTLDIVSITVNGTPHSIQSGESVTEGKSRTKESATVMGGGAALGAILGGIAGGGKGAAIGAISGAGAGAAVQILTKSGRLRIKPETRLEFTLQQPLRF